MVDIDTKTKGAGIGHRLTPFGYLASPAQWKPVPAAGCPAHKSGNSAKRVERTARQAPLLPLSGRQLGRASCRERVCQYEEISVADVSLKKHQLTRTPPKSRTTN